MDHYCDEVTLPLSFDADGRLLIDSENNRGSSLERSDEDVVWSSVPSLQAESAGIPDLRTVADNKAVLAAGLRSAAATLVFRLDSAKDIEPVGRAIFPLRRRGGRLLQIAAVETKTPLRAASLAFLLGCGANIIFENTATCGYIRIMLASLKGVVYSHPLPSILKKNWRRFLPQPSLGWLSLPGSSAPLEPSSPRRSTFRIPTAH